MSDGSCQGEESDGPRSNWTTNPKAVPEAIPRMISSSKKHALEGRTFVFTGSLPNWTRSQAKRLVEGRGGRATSSVSGRTDYVVVGRNPGRTLDDARSSGAKVIDETAFGKMVGES